MMESQELNRRHFVHGVVAATGGALGAAALTAKGETSKGAAANEISHSATETRNGPQPVAVNESKNKMTSAESEHDPFRPRLRRGLGGPWPEPSALEPEVDAPIARDGYRIEPVSFLAEPDDRVPALLLVPDRASAATPAAAVCVWHQHAGQYHLGKSEPAGLAGDPQHHTGAALARLGYVVFAIDALGFEARRPSMRSDDKGREEGGRENQAVLKDGAYERFLFLKYVVRGKSLAWKNILDMRRAVDYLMTRPEVDSARIGCYGHSMGSTHTWLVGPWEPRLKALVGNCCLPTYRGIEREGLLHCFPNFIPGIYPDYDTPDVAALIAPRPLHLNFGGLDRGSPIDEARRGAEVIARAYQHRGAAEHFSCYVEPDAGHVLSAAMWERVEAFFARHLG
jgi:dienelactone hydrolase